MVEVTATEDTKRNTTVIVTEAMEATKLNMEVVTATSLPCMVVMSSLLTEDMSHRLMEVTRLPCMEDTNSHPTEDMKRRLMEATHPTEVPDTEVIPWVMEAFRPLRFTGLTLRMTTLKQPILLRLSLN